MGCKLDHDGFLGLVCNLWLEGSSDGILEWASTSTSDFVQPTYSSLDSSCSPTPKVCIPAISTWSLFLSAIGSVPLPLNKGSNSRNVGMSEIYLILNQKTPYFSISCLKFWFGKFQDLKGFLKVFFLVFIFLPLLGLLPKFNPAFNYQR